MLRRERRLWLIVTAVLAMVTTVAAQGQKSAGVCGSVKSRVESFVEGQLATPERALTVRLEPAAQLREALDRVGGEMPLRLCVEVQRPPQGAWKGLRVFLDAPDADARTPTSTPNYVGSVAFYGGDEGKTQSFMLNLGRAVRRLKKAGEWPAGEPLVVTLVPIPSAKTTGGVADGIRVTKVTVAAPE